MVMNKELKERNQYIDMLRGLAILMVVLGHTMTGTVENVEKSIVFNIIWSVQMPLFILISGYVTKYSQKIDTKLKLWNYIKKRTISYLVPWISWTILIRGIILRQKTWLNVKWILWHMDSGYWFLFTLWTIAVIFGIAQYLSLKFQFSSKNTIKMVCSCILLMIIGSGCLLLVGILLGISFLGIKLTLYYIPFYLLGYIFGKIQATISNGNKYNVIQAIIAIAMTIYVILIANYNFYYNTDDVLSIMRRIIAAITGCIVIAGVSEPMLKKYDDFFVWLGRHSLEIYLIHTLYLGSILSIQRSNARLEYNTIEGTGLIIINFAATLILSGITTKLLSSNKYIRAILYGKK